LIIIYINCRDAKFASLVGNRKFVFLGRKQNVIKIGNAIFAFLHETIGQKMDDKFPHRKSTRYKDYDYNLPGYYFVTLCTNKMEYYLGEIKNGDMIYNKYGEITLKCWNGIPEHFQNVELDYYQIMPNHIHGIIIINDVGNAKFTSPTTGKNKMLSKVGNAKIAFPTDRTKMLLSKIIQQFKRQVTIEIKTGFNFKGVLWQKSFYDRIIRNEKELFRIRKYIDQNPLKWDLNKNTVENLYM
jgi:REP element-mobilizing transposase RayT